jgi:hypothetical protein
MVARVLFTPENLPPCDRKYQDDREGHPYYTTTQPPTPLHACEARNVYSRDDPRGHPNSSPNHTTTRPKPKRVLVALTRPFAQSISTTCRVFWRAGRVITTFNVLVSTTSPVSPTYT